MKSGTKEFVIRNDLKEIEPLAKEIMQFLSEHGVQEQVSLDLQLALEEIISNTIKYGYNDSASHLIHVRAESSDEQVLLEVEDDAGAFNPLEAPTPNIDLPVEERPVGGLGIYLVRALMDHVEYQRTATKNILRMTKKR